MFINLVYNNTFSRYNTLSSMSSEAPQTPESRETSNNKKILRELPQESAKYFSESIRRNICQICDK